MKISALASGSSGNCFYICNEKNNSAVLVDAGISCKQIVERLDVLGEDASKIKGIFVSHEHIDHVRGADVFARSFGVPVFATQGTINNCFLCSDENLIYRIKDGEIVDLNGMEIDVFSKSHDAEEPVSFAIRNGKMVSIITDIGRACRNVQDFVHESDFLIIESNHDLNMLENGPYPYFLKSRIRGINGHLSNLHSGLCVLEHGKSKLKNIMLAHLSKINNTPELAFGTFHNLMRERQDLKPKVIVSEREKPSQLFKI